VRLVMPYAISQEYSPDFLFVVSLWTMKACPT
jgi:hypothetical protein